MSVNIDDINEILDGQRPNEKQSKVLPWIITALVYLGLLAIACSIFGCSSTVTPRTVKAAQASWDNGSQNSGFIGFTPDHGGIITPHARDRYNALISDFGHDFNPPLSKDEGITPTSTNAFLIDAQHLADFATMNRHRKSKLNQ